MLQSLIVIALFNFIVPLKTPSVQAAVPQKLPIVGLMDRGVDDPSQPWTPPDPNYLGAAVTGYAVNIGWNELQPTQNGSIARNTRLDQALNQVRAFNIAHPTTQLHVRLRIFAGVNSPAWAMNLDGPAMTLRCDNIPVPYVCFTPGAHVVQEPRFWGPKYSAAYQAFVSKLSSVYDAAPEITEVDVSQCSTLYPETLIKEFDLPGNAQAYVNAGWTQQKDVACQKAQLNDFVSTWPTTLVGMSFNPYETLNSTKTGAITELTTTYMLMNYCRQVLHSRCVLENYSTRTPTGYSAYQDIYNYMVKLGQPIAFQTAIDQRVGDLNATLCTDATHRSANDIELPRGYNNPSDPYNVYRTPSQLLPYTQILEKTSSTCP